MTPDFHPGSFRDCEGRVFASGERVFRTLSPQAAERMKRLEARGCLKSLSDAGFLIPSWTTKAREASLNGEFGDTVLEHERLPLITYPYEWPFGMLQDAALLTLDLLEAALDFGLTLKDATPFNVTLRKNRMVFFDTLSLDDYNEGRPWDGYSQFCREFLSPLLLTSSTGVPFQPWMRGELDGLKAPHLSRLLGLRRVRKGVLSHVHLQAWFEKWLAKKGDVAVLDKFNAKTFSKVAMKGMVRKLRKSVSGLKGRTEASLWGDYGRTHSYLPEDEKKKEAFVAAAGKRFSGKVWVDLGCNDGKYTLIAGAHASRAIGLDLDPEAVDGFYARTRGDAGVPFYPMVCNLMNPSPSLGWRLRERASLFDRAGGEAFLALALVHHLCIGANVPLAEFVSLLKTFGRGGVVEWVGKEDAMVRRLLRNRKDIFEDYDWETFKGLLERSFHLQGVAETHGGARKLCLVLPHEG
ncbi:MAG TPA: methyltransferase [bacterium]|nr:methyltransferase [bacterium]